MTLIKFFTTVSLVLLFFLSNSNAQTFPPRLIAEIPESLVVLNSPDVRERASILNKLVVPVPQSCTGEQDFPYNLGKEDYEFIIGKILELDLSVLDYKQEAWIWGKTEFLIVKFKMYDHLEKMTKYLDHPELYVRSGIINAIRGLNAKQFDEKLVPLLSDSDKFIREETLRTLVDLGSNKAVRALIPLLSDPNHLQRYYALMSLVKVNGVEAAPYVSKLLYDESENNRFWAVDTLVKINAKTEAPKLWKFMESEKNPRFKGYALAALLHFGDKKAVPVMMKLFKDSVRGEVEIQPGEFIDRLKPKILIPEFLALYYQKERFFESEEYEWQMRLNIYNCLYHYRTRDALPIYRESLFGNKFFEKVPRFSEGIAQILIELDDQEAVDQFMAALTPEKIDGVAVYDLRIGFYLAKFGNRKANKVLIDIVEKSRTPSQFRGAILAEMNKQLDPQLWNRLKTNHMPMVQIESIESFSKKASAESGVEIIFEKAESSMIVSCLSKDLTLIDAIPCSYSDGRMSLLDTLNYIFSDRRNQRYTWIFDNGKVRILTVENAIDWWRKTVLTNPNYNA